MLKKIQKIASKIIHLGHCFTHLLHCSSLALHFWCYRLRCFWWQSHYSCSNFLHILDRFLLHRTFDATFHLCSSNHLPKRKRTRLPFCRRHFVILSEKFQPWHLLTVKTVVLIWCWFFPTDSSMLPSQSQSGQAFFARLLRKDW